MRRFTAAFLIVLLPLILLAASTQVDWTQVKNKPTFATVATSGAYADLTGKPSTWNDPGSGTVLKRTGAFTFAAALAADITTLLGFTPENSANKGAVSGYAGLNASSLVPTANLPACVASGASHAAGLVPDPGAVAGTAKVLREDCTWVSLQGSWTAPTLLNSWVNDGTGSNAGYTLDSLGFVHLRGHISSGTTTNTTALFNLPLGFRPPAAFYTIGLSSAGSGYTAFLLLVSSGGPVTIVAFAGGTIGASDLVLDGVQFSTI